MIINFTLKATDARGSITYEDMEGIEQDFEFEDSLPFIPGVCAGEYVELQIDMSTGKIVNFPTVEATKFIQDLKNTQCEDFVNEGGSHISPVDILDILKNAKKVGLPVYPADDPKNLWKGFLIEKKNGKAIYIHCTYREYCNCDKSITKKIDKLMEKIRF